ncbi:ketopantoate reductase family protein [Vannielia litorea]|uniref:ketopantoate reductase family protein n=1 Tax=Vannielia litorea TaxID=1217970 RepID=UPI001C9765D8|nr:2-dehydropantoate 2-reductase N-terminal domain-containing protein [Vannielia litorea]MBY6049336.1 ketopantoate reductase family protein [Vannielia litorea]MBY6076750.1 ketopantoate reductase family protein [Vannielia litorea]
MRIIVYGVGAIGGVVAAALALSGQEMIGIARGRMLEAIREKGLLLDSERGRELARFDCVGHPSEITFRPDDAVLLCVKGQDTAAALADLRAAGLTDQPVFCCQNGVANEPFALRFFPNVHAVTVMMPASYLEPGEVQIHCQPKFGVFDIGRYPGGHDGADDAMAEALNRANIATEVRDDAMAPKYGKLILNLGNITGALLPPGADCAEFDGPLRDEGKAVLKAAGIAWEDVGKTERRAKFMQKRGDNVQGRAGNSTTQSLARATGSVETDWLNGEIVQLARQHGVRAPLNARVQALSVEMMAEGGKPGSLTADALRARLFG